ncbi:MAG TPA: hypothetical protein VFC74_10940, partial [Oscillospiraceae bacterium]|nr:hypothetical protein [Oscillospiraceae bacterium]
IKTNNMSTKSGEVISGQVDKLPLLKYFKHPVESVSELYRRYPMGGEFGWFTFVYDLKTFAYWDIELKNWRVITGSGGLEQMPYIGTNKNWWLDDVDTGWKAVFEFSDFTEENIDLFMRPALEAAETADTAADRADTSANAADAATASTNQAIENANIATGKANTATTEANTARDNANTAAGNADEKASMASAAASNANAAAAAANTAQGNAIDAASGAWIAVEKSELASSNANAAASTANTAASVANTATSEANTARDRANTSADNADEKAAIANTAASRANDAANEIDETVIPNSQQATADAIGAKNDYYDNVKPDIEAQGLYAKEQGDYAKAQGEAVEGRVSLINNNTLTIEEVTAMAIVAMQNRIVALEKILSEGILDKIKIMNLDIIDNFN